MGVPGFSAEATIYRSVVAYQAAWACGEAAGSHIDSVQAMRLGPGNCRPVPLGQCVTDVGFPTGCSQLWLNFDCSESKRSCSSCSEPCKGGRFCGGICTDISSDPSNCGACGQACGPGVPCNNGTCGCLPGQTKCGDSCCLGTCCNGTCTDTNSDKQNCGGCDNACGVGENCLLGTCFPGCLVDCSRWNGCKQQCGGWPPGLGNAGCWEDCLKPWTDCLNSTC